MDGFCEAASNLQLASYKRWCSSSGWLKEWIRDPFALLEKHIKKSGNKNEILRFHFKIHQKALWGNLAGFADVMKVVVKAVNFI